MCKENLYNNNEKLEAQICRYTRQGLKLCPATDTMAGEMLMRPGKAILDYNQ